MKIWTMDSVKEQESYTQNVKKTHTHSYKSVLEEECQKRHNMKNTLQWTVFLNS